MMVSITKFQAGAAWADITPNRPLPNYNNLVLQRSADTMPLKTHVVVCQDRQTSCAIISIDVTFLDQPLIRKIRKNIHNQTGIPPFHILLAATHTHAAPATCPSFLSGARPDRQYLEFLVSQTCQAACQAQQAMKEVWYRSGRVPSPVGWRRRWLDKNGQAYLLPEVELQPDWAPETAGELFTRYILFETAAQEPVSLILNIPCHNNFVSQPYHADFFGCAGEFIRKQLGPNIVPVTLPAPSGDISCRRPEEFGYPGDLPRLAESAGQLLAEMILADLKTAERQFCDTIICRRIQKRIADRTYRESDFCHDNCRGNSADIQKRIRLRYDPEEAAVKERGLTSCPVECQGIALGRTALVTNPANYFPVMTAGFRMLLLLPSPWFRNLPTDIAVMCPTRKPLSTADMKRIAP